MQKEMQSFSETCYACTNVSCCIAILDANRIIAHDRGVAQSRKITGNPTSVPILHVLRTDLEEFFQFAAAQ